MNFKSLGNESEGFKRKWLVEVCNIYPTHLLSYVPMLTDYDPADRRAVVKDFLDEFELLKLGCTIEYKKFPNFLYLI
jgi:hypothetical protein